MNKNKFILEIIKDENSTKTEFKTLRQISEKLGLEYHQIRCLYIQSKKPAKLHPFLLDVSKNIKIYDNPSIKIDFSNINLNV